MVEWMTEQFSSLGKMLPSYHTPVYHNGAHVGTKKDRGKNEGGRRDEKNDRWKNEGGRREERRQAEAQYRSRSPIRLGWAFMSTRGGPMVVPNIQVDVAEEGRVLTGRPFNPGDHCGKTHCRAIGCKNLVRRLQQHARFDCFFKCKYAFSGYQDRGVPLFGMNDCVLLITRQLPLVSCQIPSLHIC